ncbi:MAG TPA: T9SS type A sorting domain-containing protein, partial [Flavobacteriales bacterium]|nr:T9SS type A sorting domain-containing protein [Flavobacteriales bacterium]
WGRLNQQPNTPMIIRVLALSTMLAAASSQAQFTLADVQFWVGAGADSSVLVVDFQDGTEDPSYAWGFLHDAGATGLDMLEAIAAADGSITVDIVSGFLNSMTYGTHAGIGGAPDYWSTWSGADLASLETNLGLSEVLSNGSWFGCSYTDFDPPLAPTTPIAATNATAVVERSILDLGVCPQPATDVLFVRVNEDGTHALRIHDLGGRTVFTGRTNGLTTAVDVAGWAPGTYVLVVGDTRRIIAIQ